MNKKYFTISVIDDGRINRATTASKEELYPSFSYLKDFIR